MKQVLVVEHDTALLELLDFVLKDAGYVTHLFRNEDLVFEYILAEKPDAIILDVLRPSEAGTLLCRKVARHPQTKSIPIIVLSTHPKMSIVKDICADELLAKPFDIELLIEVLEEQILHSQN